MDLSVWVPAGLPFSPQSFSADDEISPFLSPPPPLLHPYMWKWSSETAAAFHCELFLTFFNVPQQSGLQGPDCFGNSSVLLRLWAKISPPPQALTSSCCTFELQTNKQNGALDKMTCRCVCGQIWSTTWTLFLIFGEALVTHIKDFCSFWTYLSFLWTRTRILSSQMTRTSSLAGSAAERCQSACLCILDYCKDNVLEAD